MLEFILPAVAQGIAEPDGGRYHAGKSGRNKNNYLEEENKKLKEKLRKIDDIINDRDSRRIDQNWEYLTDEQRVQKERQTNVLYALGYDLGKVLDLGYDYIDLIDLNRLEELIDTWDGEDNVTFKELKRIMRRYDISGL